MNTKHTATFDSAAYKKTVDEMRSRGESAHAKGEQTFRETGKLDPMVDVFGKLRVSRNAMVKDGDAARLVHGPKLPILFAMDGTGSMGEEVAKALYAMGRMNGLLEGLRVHYQTDLSYAVMQDVCDRHPPYQMAEFESDQRIAEHIRLLVPDKGGGDETEDYDLGFGYVDLAVETDISGHYGLKGHFQIVADEIGRGAIYPDGVQRYLGHTLQSEVSTRDICRRLLKKWHLFYIQVLGKPHATSWWTERLGKGRVIPCPDTDLLAELQAGLIYVVETAHPSQSGLSEFLLDGGANRRISQSEVSEVWHWLQVAREHFGAQTLLSGYADLPKPGDVFSHYRDPWPIGHPRFAENPSQGGKPAEVVPETAQTSGEPDWSRF